MVIPALIEAIDTYIKNVETFDKNSVKDINKLLKHLDSISVNYDKKSVAVFVDTLVPDNADILLG